MPVDTGDEAISVDEWETFIVYSSSTVIQFMNEWITFYSVVEDYF